ncbi:MAG: 16S rRNA (adenine(1518)-N(6)/adenine(1519)-N(6))-dimethyltransferase RsmA [Gammaproteobacteria bacterium]|nr:16S rRNA (adenine(1518)-N(6)/adenine(1519)-N(6))-dimethyltransferase RsmA [Gammaproteobacteria bacterium]
MTTTPARKRFGQHFLHDTGVLDRIVQAFAPQPSDHVVEIGPGHGVLTRVLAPQVTRLHALEIDRDLAAELDADPLLAKNVTVYNADALSFDYCALVDRDRKLRVIGNLPYNISTPLLFRLLDQVNCLEDMCFMLQNEVVDRLCAQPNSKAYGRLGVMVQWRCGVEKLLSVKPAAFRPPPKVDSAVVHLRPHAKPPVTVNTETVFAGIVQAAFVQRRKILRNALKDFLNDQQIRALDIDPMRRGETLTLEEFAALSNAVERQ